MNTYGTGGELDAVSYFLRMIAGKEKDLLKNDVLWVAEATRTFE